VIPDPADALRDSLALLRAVHAGDADGIEAVAANLSWPGLTATLLAELLDVHLAAYGDRIEVLDDWQRRAGL
jgi:hypothetical protein